MIWDSQEAAVKSCTCFSFEIFMVWESPGSCWETSVDDLEYQGSCVETITHFSYEILMVLEAP